ncbi:MAG: 3-deoxy-7-phosphoheptulonate synthase [Erysipelotrichaceae bacterium]|nr:3-deoxy-7-phosphoheptulonate synthase [Erysipelotrichaceae bacterium]
MLLIMKKHIEEDHIQDLLQTLKTRGLQMHRCMRNGQLAYGLFGDKTKIDIQELQNHSSVEDIISIKEPYKLASRAFHPEDTIISIKDISIGQNQNIVVIAGPCSIENQEQIETIAKGIHHAGAKLLRGGAYKPRTSPYTYQGLGEMGVQFLKKAGDTHAMPIVSELMSEDQLQDFIDHVDIIQVGARNMQNFSLLKALGKIQKPILLKRGFSNTIEEWLMAAEYILAGGNSQVILCERGIRTFETATRNTLDLSVIPIIKEKTHLPIIIDPSHATGDWKLVEAMSLAAIAAGADGLMIEVHHQPSCAWSDGFQSLTIENFEKLMEKGRKVAHAIGRTL